MENDNMSSIEFLKNNILFSGLSIDQIKNVSTITKQISLDKGDVLIQEGDIGSDFYIIQSGSVEIFKKRGEHALSLTTLHVGDSLGELALLGDNTRSASVKTLEPCVLLKINVNDLKNIISDHSIFALIYKNLSDRLSLHLRSTNEKTVEVLEKELIRTKLLLAIGNFIITVIILLVAFAFFVGVVTQLTHKAGTGILITMPTLLVLFILLLFGIKKSGYEKSFFGFSVANWKNALLYGFLYTLPILIFVTFAKWLAIKYVPIFHSISLFSFGKSVVQQGASEHIIIIMGMLYVLVSAPIQECLIRGGLQAPLQQFLIGKYRFFWAIFLSNLIFAMIHLQFSAKFSLIAFIIGLFWGWLFYRYKTLIASIFSHMLIGFWVLFVLGIQNMIISHS